MTEGVKVYSRSRLNSEFLKEIISSCKYLADKALPAGNVAVRLEIPAAHYVPFAFLYKADDSAEQNRIVFFDPFIEHCFVMTEDETVIIIAEVCGNAICRKRFGNALFDFPKPHGIYMSITYKMKIFHFIILSPLAEFFIQI